jgi:hypothetical protein
VAELEVFIKKAHKQELDPAYNPFPNKGKGFFWQNIFNKSLALNELMV